MNLSISNIAWDNEHNELVYGWMQQYGYTGLEIAPTKIFPESPYDHLQEAAQWSKELGEKYGFCIPSMQSIWFGRQEKLFGTGEERSVLLEYSKKAVDFAAAIGCGNLVFGCPRNRQKPDEVGEEIALEFFYTLGEYAKERGTVIGMEANPPMYQTNYINDTPSALALIQKVNSRGFLLNLDVGTMISNGESVDLLEGKVSCINHVHISEPGLKPIEQRTLHSQLLKRLEQEQYQGFVSIEMGKVEPMEIIQNALSDICIPFTDKRVD